MTPVDPATGLVEAGPDAPASGTEHVRPANVWVVRAGVDGRYAKHFLANGYVAFGELDLASASDRDEVRRRYEDAYPTEGSGHVGNSFHLKVTVSQYDAFLFDIQKDDYVITPERDTERLRYGRIIGSCESAAGDDGCPYRNRPRRGLERSNART